MYVIYSHGTSADELPESTLSKASNFCRSPGPYVKDGPYCYTTDPNKQWEYCDVDFCPGIYSSSFIDYEETVSWSPFMPQINGESCVLSYPYSMLIYVHN